MVSLICVSQKYNAIPKKIRVTCNILVLFSCMKTELDDITREILYRDVNLSNILKIAFDDNGFFIYNIQSNVFYRNFDKIDI
jgi:hypothetical protein